MTRESARKINKAYVVSLTPDVCLTPMGATMVPVPYSIIAIFDTAEKVSPKVRMTGKQAFHMGSYLPSVVGNEAGTGGGILSGINRGKCFPVQHSSTVRVQGQWLVRHDDLFEMNCASPGNTIGKAVYYLEADVLESSSGGGSLKEEYERGEPGVSRQKKLWSTTYTKRLPNGDTLEETHFLGGWPIRYSYSPRDPKNSGFTSYNHKPPKWPEPPPGVDPLTPSSNTPSTGQQSNNNPNSQSNSGQGNSSTNQSGEGHGSGNGSNGQSNQDQGSESESNNQYDQESENSSDNQSSHEQGAGNDTNDQADNSQTSTSEEKSLWEKGWDMVKPNDYHDVVDYISYIPGANIPAGIVNTAGYLMEGQWGTALFSAVDIIPGGKWAKKAGEGIRIGANWLRKKKIGQTIRKKWNDLCGWVRSFFKKKTPPKPSPPKGAPVPPKKGKNRITKPPPTQAGKHMIDDPPSIKNRRNGIKGGHNKERFTEFLNEQGKITNGPNPVAGIDGVEVVEYKLFKMDKGVLTDELGSKTFTKTLFDPKKWDSSSVGQLGNNLFGHILEDGHHFSQDGKWEGWIREGILQSFGVVGN